MHILVPLLSNLLQLFPFPYELLRPAGEAQCLLHRFALSRFHLTFATIMQCHETSFIQPAKLSSKIFKFILQCKFLLDRHVKANCYLAQPISENHCDVPQVLSTIVIYFTFWYCTVS